MKKLFIILSISILIFTFQTATAQKEIMIGNQVWMADNLNVDKLRNGDSIFEVKSIEEWQKADINKTPAWCYYDNDPSNGAKYGKLYNWYAVNDPRGLAPEGWCIPSNEEWTTLANTLGGRYVAGKKMKSKTGWIEKGNGSDKSGFSALPGGRRYPNGSFNNIGKYGNWWSSSDDDIESTLYASSCKLASGFNQLSRYNTPKGVGMSIRCIKILLPSVFDY